MYKNTMIRMAKIEDAEDILKIYAEYVINTPVTFEYEVPTVEEFSKRIADIIERYPYLVATNDEEIIGYAYASAFKNRAAYDWAVETSVYVKRETHGYGVGNKLYKALEVILKKQNIVNLNACISFPNPDSVAFHEKLGYRTVAHFTKCGYKLGVWYDMIWMEKMLGEHMKEPKPVININELLEKENF